MKTRLLLLFLTMGCKAMAQTDPVVMSINGKSVTRSEFEYAYKKNRTGSQYVSVTTFAKQYALYKQKVAAAEEAQLDKQPSFKQELEALLTPSSTSVEQVDSDTISEEMEQAARRLYREEQHEVDSNGGLVSYGEIFLRINQRAKAYEESKAHTLADSIYRALRSGADFEALAKRYSHTRDGRIFFVVGKYEVLEEVEKALFSMKAGELSRPIRSSFGLHILKLIEKGSYPAYEVMRPKLLKQVEMAYLRQQIIEQQQKGPYVVTIPANVSEEKKETIVDENLLRELRDGLLVAAITQQELGFLANNKAELQRYFRKNKKKFRGVVDSINGVPSSMEEVLPLVEASYKQTFERSWEKKLKKKYKVVINKKVLSTISHK